MLTARYLLLSACNKQLESNFTGQSVAHFTDTVSSTTCFWR